MNDAAPIPDPSRLPLADEERIDQLGTDFEREWKAGNSPRIEDYLPQVSPEARPVLLSELVALEVEFRSGAEEAVEMDEYLQRFSEPADSMAVHRAFSLVKQRGPEVSGETTRSLEQPDEDTGSSRAADPTNAATPESIDRYRILRRVGRGGFGEVYLAHDPDLDRQVALKVPRLDRFDSGAAVEMFLEEARKAAQLDHPGVVRVLDVQRAAGRVFIVQQYIDGEDLASHAKTHPLSHRQVAELLISVAEAVGYAHQRGFVHRDLKPGNILLDSGGKPFVADFGLALHESVQRRHVGERAGTRAYMSPEQARGESHRLDGRSDIWSLGVILYELLTGRRPFRGETGGELLDDILGRDPKPPRMVDPTLPAELSRICLVCLAKRATDRYQSTADLIDDLRHWLDETTTQQPATRGATEPGADSDSPAAASPPKIIPQGLRSFEAEHADFYLDLLPGPHDREGLPKRVRFWKRRLDEPDPDETFALGLMYGPSGCGKSSLVKAGILPRVADHVLPIYVESTAADTEVRLIKALRKRCPELSTDDDLTELFDALRRQGGSRGRKVVVVIDQFEQWLHAHTSDDDSQLIPALRHCDGRGVQCVVLVRDDFWMSATRFMQALEIPLVEDRNSALVDLFDADHALKVLAAFGRAYGKLPDLPTDPSEEQARFLEQAVSGLADDDGKVVCVRLAVFAEMMKGRPWTVPSLVDVGGIEGVGVTFLEETFAAKTAPPAHRLHQKAIRGVLTALLPEQGTDIKGQMRSYEELLAASGYHERRQDFDALLGILDGEVRLITPTEPDEASSEETEQQAEDRYYQLAHDFLVPSLREWLTRKQKETRKGRAELRLAERAALWNAKPEKRHLPSALEWARIRGLTEKDKWTPSQREMMRQAGRLHGIRALLTIFVAILLTGIGYGTYGSLQGSAAVESLLAADAQNVSDAAKKAATFRFWTEDDLRRVVASDGKDRADRRTRVHARLALLHFDPAQVKPLLEELLTTEDTSYVGVIRKTLIEADAPIEEECWSRLHNADKSATERFRAGVALAGVELKHDKWDEGDFRDFELLVDQLAAMNSVYQPLFWPLLEDIGDRLLPPLETLFGNRDRPESEQIAAANAIAFFADNDAERLSRLLLSANGPQYNILYDKYKNVVDPTSRTGFAAAVAKQPTDDLDAESRIALGKERATSAITLLRLGEQESILAVMRYNTDPEALSQFVHRCRARGVTPAELIELLEIVDQRRGHLDGNRQKIDNSVMYALLLALGEFAWNELPPERQTLVQRLEAIYEKDPSSGVHSATGWLLRRWGQPEIVARVDQTPLPYDETGHREWFVREIEYPVIGPDGPSEEMAKFHLTFIVFQPDEFTMGSPDKEPYHQPDEAQHQVKLTRRIAVCDRELTWAQWDAAYGPRKRRDYGQAASKTLGDDDPVFGVDWFHAVNYCRWLTERAELTQCYQDPSSLPKDGEGNPKNWPLRFEGTGFRLPTEAEWEFACRSRTGTAYSFGHDEQSLGRYAWYQRNSDAWWHPTAELRPNPRGLFDIHGNVFEWCHDGYNGGELSDARDPVGDETARLRVHRGGSWADPPRYCRSSLRRCRGGPTYRNTDLGFRPVAVLPSQGPEAQEEVSGANSAGR